MLRRIVLLLGVLGGLTAGLLLPATVLAAADPFGGIDCGVGDGSAVCEGRGNTEDPIAGPNGVLITATNIFAIVAGIAAVIFLVFGGIKYITAAGQPAEVQKAKDTVIYALVGIVLIAVARSVIGFVLSRV